MHIKSTSRKIVDQSIEEVHRAMYTRIFHVTTGHVEQSTHVRWEGPEEELEYI